MLFKWIIGIGLFGLVGMYNGTGSVCPVMENSTQETISVIPENVDFDSSVLPILKTNCNPCHFPGGKMYESMPFDQSSTLIKHSEGILKRIKDDKENKTLRAFLNKQKTGEPN